MLRLTFEIASHRTPRLWSVSPESAMGFDCHPHALALTFELNDGSQTTRNDAEN